jgi:hypothetical protein
VHNCILMYERALRTVIRTFVFQNPITGIMPFKMDIYRTNLLFVRDHNMLSILNINTY